MLNWADFAIIGVVALSTLISFFRGLVREVLSLATWIIAFLVAFKFFDILAAHFSPYIQTDSIRRGVAFAIIFAVILLIGIILNHLFSQLISKSGLHGPDKTLGLLFGFGRGVLIIGIVLLLASLSGLKQDNWWTESKLIPYFDNLITWMGTFIPEKMSTVVKNAPTNNNVTVTST